MLPLILVLGFLSTGVSAAPQSPPIMADFSASGFPATLSKARLRGLLQDFVDAGYGRCFRHLGDERDFDHGHFLLDERTGKPFAILYHTQELAHAATEPGFGYVDASARNWIQWLDGRGIENARRYERAAYPRSGAWDWFVSRELPKLRARRTISDKMLDPERLGAGLAPSRQWTFTRVDCGPEAADASSNVIGVRLPDRTFVCLALSAS